MKDENSEAISEEYISSNIQYGKPMINGVYFLIYKNEIVYIGRSKNIKNRLKQHKKSILFKFDSYSFYHVHRLSKESTYVIEKACIKKYKPKYNISCNPDCESGLKKVWFTFVSQWKSYRKVAEECNLPISMVERTLMGENKKKNDTEENIKLIERTILSREIKLPIGMSN